MLFCMSVFKTVSLFSPGCPQILNLLSQSSTCWSYRHGAWFPAFDCASYHWSSFSVFCFALMKYNFSGLTSKGLHNAPSASAHISIWLTPSSPPPDTALPGSHNPLGSVLWNPLSHPLICPGSCSSYVVFDFSVAQKHFTIYPLLVFTTFNRKVLPAGWVNPI